MICNDRFLTKGQPKKYCRGPKDIFHILGQEYLLAYLNSVYDLVAFGLTCKDSSLILTVPNVFTLVNNNLRLMIKPYGFSSIEELKSFLRAHKACIAGSFPLRALGVPVESTRKKLTDLDLFIYLSDASQFELQDHWRVGKAEYDVSRGLQPHDIPAHLNNNPNTLAYNQLYRELRSKGYWLTRFILGNCNPYETSVVHLRSLLITERIHQLLMSCILAAPPLPILRGLILIYVAVLLGSSLRIVA